MMMSILKFIVNYLFIGALIYGTVCVIIENGDKNGLDLIADREEMLDGLYEKLTIICIITLWPILLIMAIYKKDKE